MRVWTVWMDFWGVAVTRLWTMKSLTGWTLSKVGLLGLILTILMEPISEYPTWKQTSPPENGQLQHGKSFFAAPNHGSVALQNYPSRLSGMIRLCHPLATSLCHVTSGKIYLLYVYRQTDNNKIKQNTDRFWFSFDWEPRWDPIDSEVFTMVNPIPESCVKKRIYGIGYTPPTCGNPQKVGHFSMVSGVVAQEFPRMHGLSHIRRSPRWFFEGSVHPWRWYTWDVMMFRWRWDRYMIIYDIHAMMIKW